MAHLAVRRPFEERDLDHNLGPDPVGRAGEVVTSRER